MEPNDQTHHDGADAAESGIEHTQRQLARESVEILQALRTIATQARRDRHKQTTLILTVISGIFLIRMFVPPAWTLWFPL